MRVLGRLSSMQARAESLMTEAFDAYKPTTGTDDGLETTTFAWVASTPGKVAGPGKDTNTRTVDVGGVERPVVEGGLHIPLAAFTDDPDNALAVGWEFVCTAVGAQSDPSLLGRRYRVVDVPAKSHATARRLDVVEV